MTEDANTMVAGEVIDDLLNLVPRHKRLDVLNAAIAKELARKTKPLLIPVTEFVDSWVQSPRRRYWHDIMRFESLVVQVFTRNITNNHSKEDAANVLFARHRNGHGSGWLVDYLHGLPALYIDREQAAAIADDEKQREP
jgi:hypothetical protein